MAVEHNTLPSEAQHIIHRWKVADETALNAIVPTLSDVDKIALREDNDTFYRLKSHDPIVWVQVGSSGTVDLTNYYTKTEVDTLISSIDYSSYYTKTEVDTLIANLPQTDLSGYYTKSEVDTLIAGIETGTVDLSNYYTKSETYNKTEIDTAIASVTPAELTNNLSHITQIKMTHQEGSIYKYTPPLTTWFTLPFNYASIDDLLQFDSATHTITAKKTGYYIINMSVVHLQTATDGASAWTRYALVDGSFDTSLTTPTYGNSHYYSQTFSSEPAGLQETISLYLTIGQSIKIVMYTGHSTAYIGTNNETDTFYSTYINMYMLSGVGVVNEGLNAYELAVQEGYVGTLTNWLNSLKGADGNSGLDGTDGSDGLSAYQVWLNLGNTGTEQDFINSLKGNTGDTGATGADGVGVPTGGTTGQILAKVDNTDYNTEWIDAPTGGGSAEYPDMTGNAGKVLGTDGTNVSWVDNGDAVALNMRYGRAFLDMTTSPGAVGTSTDWLQTFDNNTIDSSQKLTDKRLLLKAGRLYKINGGIDYMTYSGTGGAFNTSFYVAKVSDGVFNLVAGTDAIAIPITATGHVSREARVEDAYIRPSEDSWLECRVTRNDVSGISLFRTEYAVTEYLNVTGEGAISLPSVIGQTGKFLSNNGTDIEWVKPEFNGLSELPQYQLNTEVLTSERWLNGKPIYRQTIDCGTLPNNASKTVAIPGLASIDRNSLRIVSSKSRAYRSSDNVVINLPHTHTTATAQIQCSINSSGQILLDTDTDYTAFTGIVTVEYTKTVDTVNSPVALVGNEAPLIFSGITNQLSASGTLSLSTVLIDTHSVVTNPTDILIPADGIYELHIHGNIDQIGQLGIQVNGVTQTNGYENDDRAQVSCTIIRNLVANDIVSFMFTEISSTGAMLSPADVYIKKIDTASGNVGNGRYNISSTEYILPFTRNGKTVYGIEIDCGNMPNNTTKNVAIPNYNNAYDYDIVKFKASDLTYRVNVPIQWSATTYIERWITRASGSITVVANFNASSLSGKCVLEYTKD